MKAGIQAGFRGPSTPRSDSRGLGVTENTPLGTGLDRYVHKVTSNACGRDTQKPTLPELSK